MRAPLGAALTIALLVCTSAAAAQARAPSPAAALGSPLDRAEPPFAAGDPANIADAPLWSLALPGWGQAQLGQKRAWMYAAVEASAWVFWASRRSSGHRLRREYRDLAWSTARLQAGARRDGDFAYYEHLSKWNRSGAFDADPSLAGIQPEDDPSSFNGSIWALARDIYLPGGTEPSGNDAAFQQALAYYVGRAYGPEMLWDWTPVPGEKEHFSSLISRSDDRFRQATTAVGVIIANHLISAADAYVSGTPRRGPSPLAVWGESHHGRTRWSAVFRLRAR